MLWVRLMLFSASVCMAQVLLPELCDPNVETASNFNATKYLGTWYEAEKYYSSHELDGKCIKAEYTLADNGTIRVKNTQITTATNLPYSVEGTAVPTVGWDVPKLNVTFDFGSVKRVASYWVLDTTDDYALVSSCKNQPPSSLQFAWILTREQNPSDEVIEQAHQAADRRNISRKYFIKTDQKNCPTSY